MISLLLLEGSAVTGSEGPEESDEVRPVLRPDEVDAGDVTAGNTKREVLWLL